MTPRELRIFLREHAGHEEVLSNKLGTLFTEAAQITTHFGVELPGISPFWDFRPPFTDFILTNPRTTVWLPTLEPRCIPVCPRTPAICCRRSTVHGCWPLPGR